MVLKLKSKRGRMKYTHECDYDLPSSGYGDAITSCIEDKDGMFVDNGEYLT